MKLFIMAMVIVVAVIFYNRDSQPEIINYDGMVAENVFELSGDNQRLRYKLNKNVIALEGVATMTTANKNLNKLGMLLTVHMFSHKNADNFVETHENSALCPAPFFNQHAEHKLLIASNQVIADEISDWKLSNYNRSELWENFTIKGQCIEGLQDGEVDGEPLLLDETFFENCRSILVNELQRSPHSR